MSQSIAATLYANKVLTADNNMVEVLMASAEWPMYKAELRDLIANAYDEGRRDNRNTGPRSSGPDEF